MGYPKKGWYIVAGFLIYWVIHLATHAFTALALGAFAGFRWEHLGLEVYMTWPVSDLGMGLFSVMSSVVTILCGYLLVLFASKAGRLSSQCGRGLYYYTAKVLLCFDPIYIWLLSAFCGGDIHGIVAGFGISYWMVRILYIVVFAINLLVIRDFLSPYFLESKRARLEKRKAKRSAK